MICQIQLSALSAFLPPEFVIQRNSAAREQSGLPSGRLLLLPC